MAPRTTRGAAAKVSASNPPAGKENEPQQLSSPPSTPATAKPTANDKASDAKPKGRSTNKTQAAKAKTKTTATESAKKAPEPSAEVNDVVPDNTSAAPAKPSRKRKRTAAVKIEADPEELPHGLGRIKKASNVKPENANQDIDPAAKNPDDSMTTITKEDVEDIKTTMETTVAASALAAEESPIKKARRAKKSNPYGIILGETPYPDLLRPTPEECQKVNDILSEKHGAVAMPESIPLPSLTVAGCGEVPCVLEALLRTLLSAHTSNGNAALAVQGLIKRFGVLKSGMSQGCIDWNAARLAGQEEIREAIKRGGLANSKSKYIEGILNMVYEENQARRAELATKAKNSKDAKVEHTIDPKTETVDPNHAEAAAIEKASEIMLADTSALTLDYVHAMSANAAFSKLITLPGIGVKTASCTLLFCMQRPSFAVDTHVFRLCRWLGWVPPTATRDTTFAHCDVRVPDKLKYSLHQLLIKHGKECGRCRAITGEASEAWEEGCVIEELVERTGKKKGGVDIGKVGKGKKKVAKDEDEIDVDDEQEEEVVKKGKNSKAKGKAAVTKGKKKKATEGENGMEVDGEEKVVKKGKTPKAKGKGVAVKGGKKKAVDAESEMEVDDEEEALKAAKGAKAKGKVSATNAKGKKAPRKSSAAKKAEVPVDSDEDEQQLEEEGDDDDDYNYTGE